MAVILILDDEEYFREMVATYLRGKGYKVVESNNTADGLKRALEFKPNLILSDICMDGGDGHSFLKQVRANPEISTTPFLLMTGNPDSEGMLKGAEAAADGYLPKPFSLPTLMATIENRLGREALFRKKADEVKGQLQLILQASPDLIGILDPQSLEFLFLNAAGRKMLDVPEGGENLALVLRDVHPPQGWALLQQEGIPLALGSGLWRGENTLRTLSGAELPVKQSVQAHRSENGTVAFLSTIAHDLSDQKQVESALRESEKNFRSLIDSLPDAVLMHGREGKILFSNSRAIELLGFSDDELQDQSLYSICPPVNDEAGGVSVHSVHSGRSCLRRNGEHFPAHILTNDFEAGGKNVQLTIIRDLTAHKELERQRELIELQLRQALKLESIGQLAAGIAHEINTPTQYIGDNLRFLRDSVAGLGKLVPRYKKLLAAAREGVVTRETIAEVEAAEIEADIDYTMSEVPLAIQQSLEGVDRVSSIVRAMKDFSHPGVCEKEFVDINHLIESTVTVARNEWKYVAELEAELDRNLPPVPCLPGEFNQVILNLIINAAHAIGNVIEPGSDKKGRIRIATGRRGDLAEIRVQDTGTGIPEAIHKRIFEPFFTTKEVGRGTGQGLAIARSVVVDKHGGTIDFVTEIGQGTTFIIHLPLSETDAVAA